MQEIRCGRQDAIQANKNTYSKFFKLIPMRNSYESKLAELKREIEEEGARVAVIDALVNDILSDEDRRLAADLLSLLSDRAEHDEAMFSLIHAAESCGDPVYVHAFLSIFPVLMASSLVGCR